MADSIKMEFEDGKVIVEMFEGGAVRITAPDDKTLHYYQRFVCPQSFAPRPAVRRSRFMQRGAGRYGVE